MKPLKYEIDKYWEVYHYLTKLGYKRICEIVILDHNPDKVSIKVCKDYNDFFKYTAQESHNYIELGEEFDLFKREYYIDNLLSENLEPINISENKNISYLRYESMMESNRRKSNYYEKLNDYLKNLKEGDPVYHRKEKGVIYKVNSSKKTYDVYNVEQKLIIQNIKFNNLMPRKRAVKKDISQLNPNLNELNTRDLLYLKNSCYGRGWTYSSDGQVTIEEIKDVLNTRENI